MGSVIHKLFSIFNQVGFHKYFTNGSFETYLSGLFGTLHAIAPVFASL
ncbi:MAG TPA: hypothetical protein V6C84_11620 [Coleofasciculaceae cyanobacterium]|jgi:hypothetical protein